MRECSPFAVEGATIVRVMQIHPEVVGKAEHNPPEGVACPTPLTDTQSSGSQLATRHFLRVEGIALRTINDIITVSGEIGRVTAMRRHLAFHDRRRDDPLGVHLHMRNFTIQQGCLCRHGATTDLHR